MQNRQGIFIVIEGTDGSGKGTQFTLLAEYLRGEGYDVETFDFPRYDQPSSYFVKEYLNGAYGGADEVGPYTSSLFYALDRYQAAPKIQAALAKGKVVLSNRFTGSSMGHQGTKFQHAEERRGYFIWLDNLEFEMLKIPRPDVSFVLRVPADIAQQLVDQKDTRTYTDKKRDIHEADLTHLERAVAVYDDLCQLFPKDFQRIDCVRSGQLMTIDDVQEIIRQKIEPLLPTPTTEPTASAKQTSYHVPESLDPATKAAYCSQMDDLLQQYAALLHDLHAFLAGMGEKNSTAEDVLRAALPVAAISSALPAFPSTAVKQSAKDFLPAHHTTDFDAISLAQASPRNELDLLPAMVFRQTNVPLKTLKTDINGWSYEQKIAIFETYLSQLAQDSQALAGAQYTWDILDDYTAQHALQQTPLQIESQELTPRYGFDVPQLVDEAGLTERFEQCFELSLKLHSLLQGNGYPYEAQYATLLGHKQRFTISATAQQLFVHVAEMPPETKNLMIQMIKKITEKHPAIGETLQTVNVK